MKYLVEVRLEVSMPGHLFGANANYKIKMDTNKLKKKRLTYL